MKRFAPIVAFAFFAACGSQQKDSGTIHAVVSLDLVATSGVTKVTVTVAPGGPTNQDLPYDPATGTFSDSFTVPVGDLTVTANAYAGATPVGSGSALVTITAGANAAVNITIYDTTGPPPVPDHGPVLLTFVVPKTIIMSGVAQALSATAFDAEGQPITFAWTQAPTSCGTFATPRAASTQWTAGGTLGTCTVAVTATANSKSDAKSQAIQIVQATGQLDISGQYFPQPFIAHVAVQGGAVVLDVARYASDATSSTPLTLGAAYQVLAYYAPSAGATVTLTDSCGGMPSAPAYGATGTEAYASFAWTAPGVPSACVLTPHLTVQKVVGTFEDSFPIVVRVGL